MAAASLVWCPPADPTDPRIRAPLPTVFGARPRCPRRLDRQDPPSHTRRGMPGLTSGHRRRQEPQQANRPAGEPLDDEDQTPLILCQTQRPRRRVAVAAKWQGGPPEAVQLQSTPRADRSKGTADRLGNTSYGGDDDDYRRCGPECSSPRMCATRDASSSQSVSA